jgi:pimeloyl-ACP methyl ester carboxylesterase
VGVTDLPVDDDAPTLANYADAEVEAIGDRREDLIVVAQSYGGYVAPIVCDRVPARLMVLVAAMIPRPGTVARHTRTHPAQPCADGHERDFASWSSRVKMPARMGFTRRCMRRQEQVEKRVVVGVGGASMTGGLWVMAGCACCP